MKLSIIIPYYNSKEYTDELLDCLDKQINPLGDAITCNPDVEVIVVDDGSKTPYKTDYPWCKVIRKRNGGCATARNRGLKAAKGEYIQFIDSDDMIPDYFIERLLEKIASDDYDVIDYSWKSLNRQGNQHNYVLSGDDSYLPNPSVCTRCFSRAYIGKNKFNEFKDSTEDEDFSRKLGYLDKTHPYNHGAITEYMYFYRTSVDNSKIKRFKQGIMKTKRIAYYYPYVSKDMKWLLDEIKAEDQHNEVWLLTMQCEIPELKRYCQISRPMQMWAHYVRGEACNFITVITPPIKCDIVMYCEFCNRVGGISTFIYNWCQHMRKYYDIIVVYHDMDKAQIERLSKIVRLIEHKPQNQPITCDTIILNRLTDKIPQYVRYQKSIQVCHACRQINYRIPLDRTELVNVSQAAKESWGAESAHGTVIHNMSHPVNDRALLLVSATRVGAYDKGLNDTRIRRLAGMLDRQGIKYLWFNFSDGRINNVSPSFVNMPATLDVQPYIARADYLVQLSDQEAYSYSVLEALTLQTALIVTPIPSIYEQGFKDGINGYSLPFDFSENMDISFLKNVPQFEYEYNNKPMIEQWRKLIGSKPTPKAEMPKPSRSTLSPVKVIRTYRDVALDKVLMQGTVTEMDKQRANDLVGMGFVEVLEG